MGSGGGGWVPMRGAIGTTAKFGERTYEVVGVLPPNVRVPARADIYYPSWVVPETTSRSAHNYRVIGRLAPGVTIEQANEEITAIARRLEQQYPASNGGKLAVVVPLQDQMVGDARLTLQVLLAAVGLVLVIACANVANLLLARATLRGQEMVVRAAIGAGRGRLIRQLLTESLVLALAAGAIGTLFGALGLSALLAIAPADLPRLDEVGLDGTALAFAFVLSALSSLLFGLAPALQTSRAGLAEGLRSGGKGSTLAAHGTRPLRIFVIAEVALAVVLVFGASLLGRSFAALASVDMGFETGRLLVMRTSVPIAGRDQAPRATAFYRDVLPELRRIPGAISVAGVTSLPTAVRSNGGYWLEGGPGPDELGIRSPQAIFTVNTPDYFRTLGIPLRSGRDFSDADRRDAPLVAIVNESLARQAFPGEDPIGRRLRTGLDIPDFMTIVGVVGDVRTRGPARPAQAEIYMPYEQHPGPASSLVLVARTSGGDPISLADAMRQTIRLRNPDVPVRAESMETTMELASATPWFRAFLVGLFATVALLLALVGVYGVMACIVSYRVPEIGLRMALGARPQDVLWMILAQGGRLGALGMALGLALALAVSRALNGLLYGVTASDPLVLVTVVLGVSLALVGACYLPGRRALAVEPMKVLRGE
jgi:putative ABC transport system permease protein